MKQTLRRIKYLKSLVSDELEKKYEKKFQKQAGYMGNGVYIWGETYASDTRELFLLGILKAEGIKFDEQ